MGKGEWRKGAAPVGEREAGAPAARAGRHGVARCGGGTAGIRARWRGGEEEVAVPGAEEVVARGGDCLGAVGRRPAGEGKGPSATSVRADSAARGAGGASPGAAATWIEATRVAEVAAVPRLGGNGGGRVSCSRGRCGRGGSARSGSAWPCAAAAETVRGGEGDERLGREAEMAVTKLRARRVRAARLGAYSRCSSVRLGPGRAG